jgi:hypothetical protein
MLLNTDVTKEKSLPRYEKVLLPACGLGLGVADREVDTSLSGSESVLSSAEHEGLVEYSDATKLSLEFFNSGGEGARLLVEVGDADGGALEDGCLGRLLVRGRESLLQAVVSLAKFVTAALLRFDALLANVLAAAFWLAITSGVGGKVLVFLKVAKVILLFGFPDRSAARRTRAGGAGIATVAVD